MPSQFDRILKRVRQVGVENPYAVAQVTYRKSQANKRDAIWLRVSRRGRTVLSILVPWQKSRMRAAMYWTKTANAKKGDIVTVYDPKASITETFVVRWREDGPR